LVGAGAGSGIGAGCVAVIWVVLDCDEGVLHPANNALAATKADASTRLSRGIARVITGLPKLRTNLASCSTGNQ